MLNESRYFLLVESLTPQGRAPAWRFVLCHQGSGRLWTATDSEPDCDAGRLSALALVRGLEALPEPARVTVLTSDRNLRHGLERGVRNWAANSWRWERFGRLVPVRDYDLWRRVERALQIHDVSCRSWRLNVTEHTSTQEESPAPPESQLSLGRRPRSIAESPEAFAYEPALLVVRKAKRAFRIDHGHASKRPSPQLAGAIAG